MDKEVGEIILLNVFKPVFQTHLTTVPEYQLSTLLRVVIFWNTLGKYGYKDIRIGEAPTRTGRLGVRTRDFNANESQWRAVSGTSSNTKNSNYNGEVQLIGCDCKQLKQQRSIKLKWKLCFVWKVLWIFRQSWWLWLDDEKTRTTWFRAFPPAGNLNIRAVPHLHAWLVLGSLN